MTKLLGLFQIKTVRSAWTFLIGSGLMFLFGAYQIATSPSYLPDDPSKDFKVTFLLFWFLVTGFYMGIASWTLFSSKGREYLTAQERIPIKDNRDVWWYLKFLFACYATAFASLMLLGVLALPIAGYAVFLKVMFSEQSWLYFLVAGLVWSPLVFRYLK